jgi:hypothetical protein
MRIGRRLSYDLRVKRTTVTDRFPRLRSTAFQGRIVARGLALTLALVASAVVTVPAPGHAVSTTSPPAPPGPLTVVHVLYLGDEKGEVDVDALRELSVALEKTPEDGMYLLHITKGTTFTDEVEWKHLVPLVRERAKFAIWLGPKIGEDHPATARSNAVLFALAGRRIADQPTTDTAVGTLRDALGEPAANPAWCGAPDCRPEIEKRVNTIAEPEAGKPAAVIPDVGSFILGQARTVEYIPAGSLGSLAPRSTDEPDEKASANPSAVSSQSSDSGSSGVGLLGIVFALIVVLALGGVAVWWAKKRREPTAYRAKPSVPARPEAGPRYSDGGYRETGHAHPADKAARRPGGGTRPVAGQLAAEPAHRAGGPTSIRVHSVLEPDGYVDVDGVLYRGFWEDDGGAVPLPGERVRLSWNPAGRFVVSRAP